MADEPKPASPSPTPSDATGAAPASTPSATPPAAGDTAAPAAGDTKAADASGNAGETTPGSPAAGKATPGDPPASGAPAVDAAPLSDGTKPTVLAPGSAPRVTVKGKASITSVYRRADILTTLLTFGAALVAGAAILGAYAYINRNQAKPTPTPKVTALDKSDLEKLGAFFSGNSAGTTSEVLTISASSLFKNRVAVSSDLKVVGGLQVSATTALADLTVDKVSTLGVTNIRGALTVSGPTNLQSPTILGAGATVNGNMTVSGNGTYGGSLAAGTLNARDISVSGTLNLNGHLSIGGQNPSAAGTGLGTTASVDGNDSAGTVTVTVPTTNVASGTLVNVTFHAAYARAPHIVITPNGAAAASLMPYVLKTATGFTIGAATMPLPHNNAVSYSFEYWVVQ